MLPNIANLQQILTSFSLSETAIWSLVWDGFASCKIMGNNRVFMGFGQLEKMTLLDDNNDVIDRMFSKHVLQDVLFFTHGIGRNILFCRWEENFPKHLILFSRILLRKCFVLEQEDILFSTFRRSFSPACMTNVCSFIS